MKVYVIDNGGQWTHREWRVVRDIGHEAEIVPNTTPFEEIKSADALILSGGAVSVTFNSKTLGNFKEYLGNFKGRILGMCAGHQSIAVYYGGKVAPGKTPEYGLARMKILKPTDPLFKGIKKDEIMVWESHNDEVIAAPGFKVLASTENCKIQVMKHEEKPIYGIQFHPEVNNTEFGSLMIKNFLEEDL